MSDGDDDGIRPVMIDARPVPPGGLVRRLDLALLHGRLFGAPLPRLGRFEVRRKLGQGGMGSVFEAFDPTLARSVALKVLRAGPIDAQHEARALARVTHPNVVPVYELGVEDNERYVCMALVEGGNLRVWLDANPDASWRAIIEKFVGAARGLDAVHRAGVIHRDLKLENLLVGTDGLACVTDFGLAAVDGARPELDDDSLGRVIGVGTPGYMAPELATGPATARSDQYSFFVTLARALVDRAPPVAVVDLVRSGTAADPAARFADLGVVADRLAATMAAPGTASRRTREVLCQRVERLWIEPLRRRALEAVGELPVGLAPVPELPAPVAASNLAEVAHAVVALRAAVLILGAAGAGKTMLLLGVAERLMAAARADPGAPVPVVVHLGSFAATRGDLAAWLRHELVAKYALGRTQVQAWLDEGQLVLLLDGLDEVPLRDRVRCVDAIVALREQTGLPYVVTCREGPDLALPARLKSDVAVRVRPLDAEVVRARLPAAVDTDLVEQLRNPLLFALFARLSDVDTRGPLRERLYAAALAHALARAPARSAAEKDVAEAGLRWLAEAMDRAGVAELWLEDLQVGWLPTRAQRVAATALGVAGVFAISFAINLPASVVAGMPIASGLFFGFVAAASAFVIQGGTQIVPMEAMRWSWARVVKFIPANLALGVAMGAAHGLFFDLWADLMLGVATGLLGLSVIGLVPEGRERRVHPGEGFGESVRNSLIVAPIIGVVIGGPVGFLVLPLARPLASAMSMYHTHPNPELAWAVTMGTSAAVTSLFITGMMAPVLHAGLRVVLAATTPLPLRLTAWLDDWAERDLLTKIGGGWIFRHATLRAWLATASNP